MTYDVFLEQMKNDLQTAFSGELPEKYSQVKIGIRDVEKLQGESYRGISFRIGDSPIEGNLNLQQAYQEQEAGIPYSEILRQTKEAITQQVDRMPQFNLGELSSYEAVKQSVMMELIPQKGNEERLAEIPHRDVEDMALIYRMDMGEGSNGRMTAVITNQNLTAYGITAEQLHQDALANAPESHPASLRSLRDVMAGMMGMETDPMMPGEPVIMVATTRDSFLGASVIQYPGFMEQAAEQIGGDFFVLPSSIHEVLLVPDDGNADYHSLEAMVQSINEAEVAPADRLSDHVYHYDQADRVFELADKTAARKLEQKLAKKTEQREPAEKKTSVLAQLGEKKRRPWSMHRKLKRRGEPFPKQHCKNEYRYIDRGAFNAWYKRQQTFPFLMRRKGRRIT